MTHAKPIPPGQRFGRLVAVERCGVGPGRTPLYLCVCDCGGSKKVTSTALRAGHTRSCGCLPKGRRKWFQSNEIARPASRPREDIASVFYNPADRRAGK